MQQQIMLRLLPSEAGDDSIIKSHIAKSAGRKTDEITGFYALKKSIDARGRQPYVNLTLHAFVNEPFVAREAKKIIFKDVSKAKRKVIIIGAGPAGMFAALELLAQGIQPIILERGKDIRTRRRDLADLNWEGAINAES